MKLRITIDGTTYEADVEVLEEDESAPEYEAYQEPAFASQEQGAESLGDEKECCSPAMGLVIRVEVQAGQMVKAGQLVMVLEAMKMETHVTAPRAGKVKSVMVAAGDPVKVGQLLAEFE